MTLGLAADAQPAPPKVQLADGALRGHLEEGVAAFEGVPFAAPPVGPLRWRPPAPPRPWSGVRDAVAFAPPCAQADLGWQSNLAAASSEDCLYLNVWVPPHPAGARLPVIVFLHGGAYHGGGSKGLSGIEPSYDGARLAKRGAVVVTATYRLGMLGFLAHPDLDAESADHVSGNYALMDAIAALRWVQANIAGFGGDPGRVTLFGQSAGSWTVADLMTAPAARGLFSRAILASGVELHPGPGRLSLAEASANGASFARALGAGDSGAIAALRALPASELFSRMMADPKIHGQEPRGAVVDGRLFPQRPSKVFLLGEEAPIPLMVGTTARDGDFDSMGVSGTPKARAAAADPARPLAHPADGDAAIAQATDDYDRCGANMTARLHARRAPAWRYEFSHGYEPLGAVHLWDLQYVFGWLQPPADQPRDRALSRLIQAYIVNFARTGDPNGPGLPRWPRAGAGGYLDFASSGARAGSGPRAQACAEYETKLRAEVGKALD